jgi:nucleotide-binding universal stress UspA family protein
MKTILAPVDFSSVSESVVAAARDLARGFGGKVILLSIVQPPAVLAEYAPLLENIAELTATGEKNASRHLGKIEQRLRDDFVAVESVVTTGSPVPAILEQAKGCEPDYIVMGSHGHTALYDLLVGSTTHGVLLKAKCPVVIVPSAKVEGKAAREESTNKMARALPR